MTDTADFDSPWKEVIDLFFEDFVRLLFPEIHAEVAWSRGFEFLDKELTRIIAGAEQGKSVVDKLVKIWLPDGEENWLLLHIELQAQQEADFAKRMFRYNYRLLDCYDKEVVSLAVLADDRPSWRPSVFSTHRWGCRTEFRFPSVKLLDFTVRAEELEQSANPMAKVVLAQLAAMETRKSPADRREKKFRLVRNLYERGMTSHQVRQLFRVIDWLLQLPRDLEIRFRADVEKLEEDKKMPYMTSIERLAMEEGMEKGMEKGIVEGIQKGQREGLIKAVQLGLNIRFQQEGLALMGEIRKIRDSSKLDQIVDAIDAHQSLDEIKQLAASLQ